MQQSQKTNKGREMITLKFGSQEAVDILAKDKAYDTLLTFDELAEQLFDHLSDATIQEAIDPEKFAEDLMYTLTHQNRCTDEWYESFWRTFVTEMLRNADINELVKAVLK